MSYPQHSDVIAVAQEFLPISSRALVTTLPQNPRLEPHGLWRVSDARHDVKVRLSADPFTARKVADWHRRLNELGAPISPLLTTRHDQPFVSRNNDGDSCAEWNADLVFTVERWVPGSEVGRSLRGRFDRALVPIVRALAAFHLASLRLGLPGEVPDRGYRPLTGDWSTHLAQLDDDAPHMAARLSPQLPFLRRCDYGYIEIHRDPDLYGIVHSDFHEHNVVRDGRAGAPTIIDLADMRRGCIATDLLLATDWWLTNYPSSRETGSSPVRSRTHMAAVGAMQRTWLHEISNGGSDVTVLPYALQIDHVNAVDHCLRTQAWTSKPDYMNAVLDNVEQANATARELVAVAGARRAAPALAL